MSVVDIPVSHGAAQSQALYGPSTQCLKQTFVLLNTRPRVEMGTSQTQSIDSRDKFTIMVYILNYGLR